jgi:hypothetical protein
MKKWNEFADLNLDDIDENNDNLNEKSSKAESKDQKRESTDPPAVLIMRRQSIRLFPNNQRVALYKIDKLNRFIAVPYKSNEWSMLTPEEVNFNDVTNHDILQD